MAAAALSCSCPDVISLFAAWRLQEAGILGGTLDPARAKLWRDELVAELEAERMRAAGGNVARESIAPVRPSVADL